MNFKQAAQTIRQADSILLVPHLHPDGDALGSVLGLYHALCEMGKQQLLVVSHDPVPEIYQFLPGWERIEVEPQPVTTFDLTIACDMSQLMRSGKHETLARAARQILQIDHHVPHESFADLRLVDTQAAATAEIVYRLLRSMKHPISPEVATCLLTGIVTDTFSFKFPNTTPSSLRIAAQLNKSGADISDINEHVFEARTFSAVKLLGLALSTLQSTPDGKIAWVAISPDLFEKSGATDEETEGIVNYVRSIHGVEVAFLMREMHEKRVRVSLRSRGGVDVAAIARTFDGGGHENAAGCTLEMSLKNAEKTLLAEVQKWMVSSTSTNRQA